MTQQAINAAPVVFVVDDDIDVREGLKSLVELAGLRCEVFASTREFLPRKAADTVSCLVLDVRLPGMSGLDLQAELARTHADIPTIFITGYGDIPMAVKAMKAGAVEFLTKPVREQALLDAVGIALERDRIKRERTSKLNDLRARYRIAECARTEGAATGKHRVAEQADCRRNEVERGNREGPPSQSHEEVGREVASRPGPDGRRSRSRPARDRALIDDGHRLGLTKHAEDPLTLTMRIQLLATLDPFRRRRASVGRLGHVGEGDSRS